MLRELGEQVGSVVLDGIGQVTSRIQERQPLPVDLLESDDAYLAVFDAPGVTRSDVDVRFDDNTVRVRIDRFRDAHDGFEMRFPGRGRSLSGAVSLPEHASIETSEATAELTTGTLRVTLPKTESGVTDEPIRIETKPNSSDSEDADESNERDEPDNANESEE